MVNMSHPDAEFDIKVHPARVDDMTRKGWNKAEPSQTEALENVIENLEEQEDGES